MKLDSRALLRAVSFLLIIGIIGTVIWVQRAENDTESMPPPGVENDGFDRDKAYRVDRSNSTDENPSARQDKVVGSNNDEPKSEKQYDIAPNTPDSRVNRRNDGYVEYLPSIKISKELGTGSSGEDDLAVLDQIFSSYRYAYQENPVGVENSEFTRQLLGNNPKQIIFISEENQAIRDEELIDRWGTPYFFHPLSATSMEIRSAGPDATLWTEDDLLWEGDGEVYQLIGE